MQTFSWNHFSRFNDKKVSIFLRVWLENAYLCFFGAGLGVKIGGNETFCIFIPLGIL